MRIGPFEITRRKAADLVTHVPQNVYGPSRGGWWPVLESFAGAWQRSVTTPVQDALTHPTFWACVTLIAGDIAKNRLKLVDEDADGICTETTNPAYSPVLRKPNHYQNRIQFLMYWIISKLTRGNTYALKKRDGRGVVTALYLLDPTRVQPLLASNGDVFYALQQDCLAGITDASVVVPAREIIHDLMYPLYHPLVGLSPVYACGHAVLQGLTIIGNSTRLFKNGLQIGGVLLVPGQISNENAKRLEDYWQANYAGEENANKIVVLGDNMKFEKTEVMSAVDAEVIDHLKWGDEKICATFHMPPFMAGVGAMPTYTNIEALSVFYYAQCLQILIESLELCLDEGLELKGRLGTELDLDGLMRMDSATKMKTTTDGVKGGIYTPNEGRKVFNKAPIPGGDTVYLQQQDFSLQALAARDALGPAPSSMTPGPALPPPTKSEMDSAELLDIVTRGLLELEIAA